MGFEDQSWERRKYIIGLTMDGVSIKFAELQERFGVGKAAVYNDLKFLRMIGIDVRSVRGVIYSTSSLADRIIREITFPPEYRDAGVSILSYFARVIDEKCPEAGARVTIVQQGDTVRLHIESAKGHREIIERTLSDYGKVVKGQLLPAQFLSSPVAATDLNNKLEIARLELRLKEQSFLAYQSQSDQRVNKLEERVTQLMSLVGSQFSTVQTLSQALSGMATAERISPAVARALETISKLASAEYSESSEELLKRSLLLVREQNIGLFKRIRESASVLAHSVAGNLATPWVLAVINAFPK